MLGTDKTNTHSKMNNHKQTIALGLVFTLFHCINRIDFVSASTSLRSSKVELRNDHDPFHIIAGRRSTIESSFCPIGRAPKVVYHVPPNGMAVAEVSYMAHSSQFYGGNDVVWMGSDGPQNEILAFDFQNGAIIKKYRLDVPLQGDWESMSLGPCTSHDTKICLYIGNMGNNLADYCKSTSCTSGAQLVYIYKLDEPNIEAVYDGTAIKVSTLSINYLGGNFPTSRANSESMFVDQTGDQQGGKPGDIYFITKFMIRTDLQRLGKISVQEHESITPGSSKRVKINAVGKVSTELQTWTDAAMNLDGNLIAVRSNSGILFFPRNSLQTVVDALKSTPCKFESRTQMQSNQKQFESVTFVSSSVYMEASECTLKKPCTVNVIRYKLEFAPTVAKPLMPAQRSTQHPVAKPLIPAQRPPQHNRNASIVAHATIAIAFVASVSCLVALYARGNTKI